METSETITIDPEYAKVVEEEEDSI